MRRLGVAPVFHLTWGITGSAGESNVPLQCFVQLRLQWFKRVRGGGVRIGAGGGAGRVGLRGSGRNVGRGSGSNGGSDGSCSGWRRKW